MTMNWGPYGGPFQPRGSPASGYEGGFGSQRRPRYADLPDYIKDFLEGEGIGMRANFMARVNPQSYNERRYAGEAATDWMDRYATRLGQMGLSGQAPGLQYGEFLDEDFSPEVLRREFLRAPVERTGRGVARVAGPARFLYNF